VGLFYNAPEPTRGHNNRSRSDLNGHMNGQRLKHDPYPVYLGVTLDRIFSHRVHLSCSAAKIKSRNNLIAKLAGTSWAASACSFRVFKMFLVGLATVVRLCFMSDIVLLID